MVLPCKHFFSKCCSLCSLFSLYAQEWCQTFVNKTLVWLQHKQINEQAGCPITHIINELSLSLVLRQTILYCSKNAEQCRFFSLLCRHCEFMYSDLFLGPNCYIICCFIIYLHCYIQACY
ncbi:hypothetical protein XENTR_v10011982 [Xenopus tropicalis]|nr:hypothetical protein XENTR_v10011982 [Xenopus tropicalis]